MRGISLTLGDRGIGITFPVANGQHATRVRKCSYSLTHYFPFQEFILNNNQNFAQRHVYGEAHHSTFLKKKNCNVLLHYYFLFLLFYFYREGKGGRKRGRETSVCGCLSRTPCWGPGPQPRHVC